MTIVDVKFEGVDWWCRPLFISEKGIYYTDLSLVPDHLKNSDVEGIINYYKEHTNRLELFGSNPEDDPLGGLNPNIKLNVIDL